MESDENEMKYLSALETEFRDRYTEQDDEYTKVFNSAITSPPIVDPWQDTFRGNRFRSNPRTRNVNNEFYDRRPNRYHNNYNYSNKGWHNRNRY